jgi:hypothetical protein
LLTDLNRDKSIFELNPGLKKEVNDSVKKEGSDLSFIKSKCVWKLFDESELVFSFRGLFNSKDYWCYCIKILKID